MWSKEVMNFVVDRSGFSKAEVARRAGVPSNWIYNNLREDTTYTTTVAAMQEILDVCGYKIVVMPKYERTPRSGIEIDELA